MPQSIQGWVSLSQVVMQRVALIIIVALAAFSLAWWGSSLLGWAPWLQVQLDLAPNADFDAGIMI